MGTPVPNLNIEKSSTQSSEVKTYKLTPEEIAKRYGPPRPRQEDDPLRAKIMQAIKVSNSPEEAAKLLDITVGRLKQYLGSNGIFPRWAKKPDKENEDMNTATQMTEAEAKEKLPPEILDNLTPEKYMPENMPTNGDGQESPEEPKPKTRIEVAREKLSKEKYLELKELGKSDQQVRILYKIATDTLIALKREWEIPIGQGVSKPAEPLTPTIISGAAENSEEIRERIENIRKDLETKSDRPEEPITQTPTTDLTVSQAIDWRDTLVEDIDDYNHILEIHEGKISDRVIQLIRSQRDICQRDFNKINETFDKTVVQL